MKTCLKCHTFILLLVVSEIWPVYYPCRNSVTIAYFALSLNTSNLHGDAYLNCFLSAVVEVPAYILSWFMFRWWSRRLCLASTLFWGGIFLVVIPFIPLSMIHLANNKHFWYDTSNMIICDSYRPACHCHSS